MKTMRTVSRALVLLAAAAAITVGSASSAPLATTTATFELRPVAGSGARGVGYFEQRGERLSGWIVVWGLRPRTRHAVHFHGPNARCGVKADPVAAHSDLRADAKGVAYARVRTVSQRPILRRGFYYNVHSRPTAAGSSPEIACGNLQPR
jgi:hypothetical protein